MRQRAVHDRDRATAFAGRENHLSTDKNYPQAETSLEPSTSAISPPTEIGPELRLATKGPSQRIIVSIFPPRSFPIHIHIISAYVLI